MVVGMDATAPAFLTEQFGGAGGDHLVGVGVRRSSRASLEDVEYELVVEGAVHHLVCGLANGAADLGIDEAELGGDGRRRPLEQAKGTDEPAAEPLAGDREVVDGTLGRCPVVGIDGNLHLAHRVTFDPVLHLVLASEPDVDWNGNADVQPRR